MGPGSGFALFIVVADGGELAGIGNGFIPGGGGTLCCIFLGGINLGILSVFPLGVGGE